MSKKPKAGRKEREKKARMLKERYDRRKSSEQTVQESAPLWKAALKSLGCDLPFYEMLDSYEAEFRRVAENAKTQIPLLLGVHEVEKRKHALQDWSEFGYDTAKAWRFNVDAEHADYVADAPGGLNLGAMVVFNDSGQFRPAVFIVRNPVKLAGHTRETVYATKIPSLLHELGHAFDVEKRINIDPDRNRFDVIEAECYAHIYALNALADRCLATRYDNLIETMEEWAAKPDGYQSRVGRRVLETHEKRVITRWTDYSDEAAELVKAART